MPNTKVFGMRPGAKISTQQVALIVASTLAIILMIVTVVSLNKMSELQADQNTHQEKLTARFEDEINALGILLERQETESGEARVETLHEMAKHIYAADALSIYKVETYGGAELISTDAYSELNSLLSQSIRQIAAGLIPDTQLTEFSAALDLIKNTDNDKP